MYRHDVVEPDAVWVEVMPLWNELVGDNDDVAFYRDIVRRHGLRPVVELGVGYGRVAGGVLPDVGVDRSARALRRCARVLPATARLVEADVTDYALPEPAGFTYAPQNLLSLLPDGAQQWFFAAVWRNTRPGGRFAFDAAVPCRRRRPKRPAEDKLRGRVGQVNVWYRKEVVGETRGGAMRVDVHHTLEWVGPTDRIKRRQVYPPVSLRYLPPEHVRRLLDDAGWVVEHAWGDFAGQPLTPDSRMQVWIARRT